MRRNTSVSPLAHVMACCLTAPFVSFRVIHLRVIPHRGPKVLDSIMNLNIILLDTSPGHTEVMMY